MINEYVYVAKCIVHFSRSVSAQGPCMMFSRSFIHGGVNFQMGQTYADGYGLRNVAKSLGDHF